MGNLESSEGPAASNCRIVIVGPQSGEESLTELRHLPPEARIIATGNNIAELSKDGNLFTEANVIFNVTGTAATLGPIINEMPFLVWIHSITAGVDSMMCPEMKNVPDLVITNAKGIYSSSLAEYVIGACLYFAKDMGRLNRQKAASDWTKFNMKELAGKTMGIVGYGDIGKKCARAAKAFGMNIIALRRHPEYSAQDSIVDKVLICSFHFQVFKVIYFSASSLLLSTQLHSHLTGIWLPPLLGGDGFL